MDIPLFAFRECFGGHRRNGQVMSLLLAPRLDVTAD